VNETKKGVTLVAVAKSAILPEGNPGGRPALTRNTPDGRPDQALRLPKPVPGQGDTHQA